MYQMNNTIIIAWLPCMLYELCHEKMCLKIFVVVIYIVAVRSVRCVKRDQKGLGVFGLWEWMEISCLIN